ncbi:HNH endonuclease family protein [Synechococcus sp. A15-62]|uniref:HNH endonuclease n=1 Tax=Synechococcus sp. A15-62 TaxID=1050657 RepID=UPI0016460C5B|nr:HNH endonuclease signature motif containing protein [Synechococcus sp. A15-62]QNI99440.1 HNH endonuclease family protein [Synechococcus sp. A15-62]
MESSVVPRGRALYEKSEQCFRQSLFIKISTLKKKCGYSDLDTKDFFDELCRAYIDTKGRGWENRITSNFLSAFPDHHLHTLCVVSHKSLKFQRPLVYLALHAGWIRRSPDGLYEPSDRALAAEILRQNNSLNWEDILLNELNKRGIAFDPPKSLLPPLRGELKGEELISQCEHLISSRSLLPTSWIDLAKACGYNKDNKVEFINNLFSGLNKRFAGNKQKAVGDIVSTFYDYELEVLANQKAGAKRLRTLWNFFAARNGWIVPDKRVKEHDYKGDVTGIIDAIRSAHRGLPINEILLMESKRRSDSKIEELRKNQDLKRRKLERNSILDLGSGQEEAKRFLLLSGRDLVDFAVDALTEGVPETSICLRSGYKIDKIASFRKAFSKAASVSFGPLSRMVQEYIQSTDEVVLPKDKLDENNSQNPASLVALDRQLRLLQTKVRVRDSGFREAVFALHGTTCLCCDFSIKSVLEAAHIVPVSEQGSDEPRNGIPLCPTHHSAFDKHLFCIDPQTNLIVFRSDISGSLLKLTKTRIEKELSTDAIQKRLNLFKSHNNSQNHSTSSSAKQAKSS